jgi:hypothetical protein
VRAGLATLVALLVLSGPAALAGPRLVVEPERIDFGEINRGDKASKALRLINAGDAVLEITDIRPSCAECTVGDLKALALAPGERFELQIAFVAVDVPGEHTAHVTLSTNEEAEPLRRVYLDVDIKRVDAPRLLVEPEQLDLGVLRAGEGLRAELVLHNVGDAPLLIRDFTCGSGLGVDGRMPSEIGSDEKHVLKLVLGPPPQGVLRSHVALVTNQPDRRVVTVTASGYAARPEQVERLLDGVLVRRAGEAGTVEVVNASHTVVWVTRGAVQKLMPPGRKLQLPAARAPAGERIRLVVEMPLQGTPTERNDQ